MLRYSLGYEHRKGENKLPPDIRQAATSKAQNLNKIFCCSFNCIIALDIELINKHFKRICLIGHDHLHCVDTEASSQDNTKIIFLQRNSTSTTTDVPEYNARKLVSSILPLLANVLEECKALCIVVRSTIPI